MKWIAASERKPERHSPEVIVRNVNTGDVKMMQNLGHYNGWDVGMERFFMWDNTEWLDETEPPAPASIEDEAEALYPDMNNEHLPMTLQAAQKMQRSAHITCARMYLSRLAEMGELLMTKDGEIEGLKSEVAELKTKLYGIKHNL